MRELVIVKFGGSVVTYKNSNTPKARLEVIKQLAKEVVVLSKKYKFIIVHGAGSFGHPLAKKYNLAQGMLNKKQKFGYSLTSQKMLELNSLILKAFLQNHISAVNISPHTIAEQLKGRLVKLDHEIVKKYLDHDLLPVLFGDAVIDKKWGCSILSGDTIISYLAKKLGAKKVIFLSDVDGIFDRDPKKYTEARLIPKITNKNLKKVLQGIEQNNQDDVTGEMKGKIMAIKTTLPEKIVIITSGLIKNRLVDAAQKGNVGTILSFKVN